MSQRRQRYPQEYKVKIIFEALRGERSTKEIAVAYRVNPVLVARWKREFLENGEKGVFVKEKTLEHLKVGFAKREANLRKKVGYIKKQLAWLKRKTAEALTRDERLALVESDGCELALSTQAQLLSVKHTSPYKRSSIKDGSLQLLKTGTVFQPNLLNKYTLHSEYRQKMEGTVATSQQRLIRKSVPTRII